MKKVRPIIAFRADGSATMGLGHVYRSAALARMLAPVADCVFFSRAIPTGLTEMLSSSYEASYELAVPAADEVNTMVEQLRKHYPDRPYTFVLDGYHFKTAYQRSIKALKCLLVCIDDIHACDYVADLVINHSPAANLTDYVGETYTKYALGPRFALLRNPFLVAAQSAENNLSAKRDRIFICLGGADPKNDTLTILRKLADYERVPAVDVVLGPAYAHQKELQSFLTDTTLKIELHRSLTAEQLVDLMQSSVVGITSPSTVSLEYLSAGGKLFLHQTADNQAGIYAGLIEKGLALDVATMDAEAFVSTSEKTPSPMDGRQAERLRKLFAALDLTWRLATADDSDLYLAWANDPDVRAQSFDSSLISPSEHAAWFRRRLVDEQSCLLIFERSRKPVGRVRFAVVGNEATIGYSVAKESRGHGLGVPMLHFAVDALRRERPKIERFIGYVKEGNIASVTTFRRLGYREEPTNDYPDALKFVLYDL
ncbi:UDP-2,4-diacetamido-2,4,6-trideoxy-beta-L-altropyranose hydrolase [Neolewinella antarctica]|uniref:UDP-2,4-diacetamido-2,4, 6-trideoxy-beta-L-altropyranose hydrolase n=1 Tax=Neolewinella antarctica TaxID=442734 RepID=A0ABX0XA61_9BACT|nr:UDP-2,4-diacetamido-2,4,6-trideoxy-beta-L-altropyranose hydrolase [Neolewinella antarctica]NJC26154.1 UDP-2,4-diacetamido-2,4,6-trideoxy-beta-L-altropyranose hydrolase [Neolewinella antarctica]